METLLALLLGFTAATSQSVVNADFEQKDALTGLPAGWAFTSLPDKQDLVNYRSTRVTADSGYTNALSITVATDHPAQKVAYNVHQDLKGLTPGKKYRATARVRTRGLKTLPMIVVQCLDASQTKYLGFARSQQRDLSTDLDRWEQIETEVTIPEGTSSVRLRIGIPAEGNAGGTAIIDDVDVVEVQ